ncbi:RcnB family protein [Acinetobacter nosocomialis]|uniref:RcnB family protein n=1 Tax=Acinetobacter sp. ABJ-A23_2 TaxID=3376991 RepID=UPI0021E53732
MKKPIVLVLSTLMLGISATAMADSNNRWDDYHGRDNRHYEHHYDHRYDRRDDHRPPVWSNANRGHEYVVIKRGERIPVEYRDNRYFVSDWRAHRLYEPPRGYHWVKTPNQYLLVDSHHQVYRVR